jgi:hypothetical protein
VATPALADHLLRLDEGAEAEARIDRAPAENLTQQIGTLREKRSRHGAMQSDIACDLESQLPLALASYTGTAAVGRGLPAHKAPLSIFQNSPRWVAKELPIRLGDPV